MQLFHVFNIVLVVWHFQLGSHIPQIHTLFLLLSGVPWWKILRSSVESLGEKTEDLAPQIWVLWVPLARLKDTHMHVIPTCFPCSCAALMALLSSEQV